MFTPNLVPGQGFKRFQILKKVGGVTDTGRAWSKGYERSGEYILGILVDANQSEQDQWKQSGHPVTHKIIEYGAMVKAKATDYLRTDDGRKFYVTGINNHADLNVAVSYYVEERYDVNEQC